jgi:hypothetical protein
MRDALRDTHYGAAGVALLHAGLGTAGERLGRGAGGAASAAPIVSADAPTKNAAMRGSIAEIADGRPVDVEPVLGSETAPTAAPGEPGAAETTPAPTPTPEAAAGAVAAPEAISAADRFTTAKGSIYEVHDDGTTTRDKSFHPEHGEADQGPQPRSEETVYVSSADADKLGQIQANGPKAIIASPTGMPEMRGVKYLEGPNAGKFESRTTVKVQTEPAVGLTPVELWNGGERVHFGNEITSVEHAPVAEPGAAVAAPAEGAPVPADISSQVSDWYGKTFMAGQRPNNSALRSKIYEWSPELRQAREDAQTARRAQREAEDPSKGDAAGSAELTAAAKAAGQRERTIYNGLRKQALAVIDGSGALPKRLPADPVSAAEDQAELLREGWAPVVGRDELTAANDAVYGRQPEPEGVPETPAAGAADTGELAQAEQRMAQIAPEDVHPDDQAELASTAEALTRADTMRSVYETAASCIAGLA